MLRNFEDKVLKLDGTNLQARTETSGMLISNVFPVDIADVNFFKSGIAKVRLTTVPIVHERAFSRDLIGKYLYTELLGAYSSESTF